MKKVLSSLSIFLIASFAFPTKAFSAAPSPLDGCTDGINTAIGCISILNWDTFVEKILTFAIGISGGVAFLLMVMAGFMIMTSRGDPKRLSAGQELLTSAIMGLLLLIFSVFILKIIGVNLLEIPGFGV